MKLETLVVHGFKGDAGKTGEASKDVVPGIHLSTSFERDEDGSFPEGYSYARRDNPNRKMLELALAALEGGSDAAAFASGSAAVTAVFMALAAGEHVLAPKDAYHGTTATLTEVFARWGLAATFVDMADLAAVRAALRPNTKLLWVETPSNPLMKVANLAALTSLAHSHSALIAVDNTVATPVAQRPFEFGVDVVMHSTTKYLSGHGDVLGGVVIARESGAFFERVRQTQLYGGGVPSPFDCWLALRGLRTLALRVREQCRNALSIATFLAAHPLVERVYYAGLPSHSGHALANQQMRGLYGGLLSFQVKGGAERAFRVAAACKLITRATSLGGVESLIEHRASIEGPATTTPANLLRLAVGIEHESDLIADLRQALAADSAAGM